VMRPASRIRMRKTLTPVRWNRGFLGTTNWGLGAAPTEALPPLLLRFPLIANVDYLLNARTTRIAPS
jgi:hypothetical protein